MAHSVLVRRVVIDHEHRIEASAIGGDGAAFALHYYNHENTDENGWYESDADAIDQVGWEFDEIGIHILTVFAARVEPAVTSMRVRLTDLESDAAVLDETLAFDGGIVSAEIHLIPGV